MDSGIKFRALEPDEVECRVAECKEDRNGNGYVRLLIYKTARTDAALLDETVGAENWGNDYKSIDGKLYCGIWINSKDDHFVWKWNVGTESNMEAEKGQASDAMKRAGFVWGIGTELYSSPDIMTYNCDLLSGGDRNGKRSWKCYDRYKVTSIKCDDKKRITELVIQKKDGTDAFVFRDGKSNSMYDAKHRAGDKGTSRATAAPVQQTPDLICKRCGCKIYEHPSSNGKRMVSLQEHKEQSIKLFGDVYCSACIRDLRKESEA